MCVVAVVVLCCVVLCCVVMLCYVLCCVFNVMFVVFVEFETFRICYCYQWCLCELVFGLLFLPVVVFYV